MTQIQQIICWYGVLIKILLHKQACSKDFNSNTKQFGLNKQAYRFQLIIAYQQNLNYWLKRMDAEKRGKGEKIILVFQQPHRP